MSITTAWELGKRWYRDRLDPAWTPKTRAVMTAIFGEVGLTEEFWDVS